MIRATEPVEPRPAVDESDGRAPVEQIDVRIGPIGEPRAGDGTAAHKEMSSFSRSCSCPLAVPRPLL